MSFQDVALTIVIGVASIVLGSVVVHLAWQAIGVWRINRAGPRPLAAIRHVLWRDPGMVEKLDIGSGPGGTEYTPAAPFTFLEEHQGGSQPCVSVRDARGRRWRVKWGDEVRSENLAPSPVVQGFSPVDKQPCPSPVVQGFSPVDKQP